MKRVIRDLLLLGIAYTGIAYFYRWWCAGSGPVVRILVFHDVVNQAWFHSLIAELKKSYHVLTPQNFFTREFVKDKINVLITFDDGYWSWVNEVRPILNQEKVRGIFFISGGLLDSASDKANSDAYMRRELMIRPRAPLTWLGARLIRDDGHTIGSHAYNHVNLAKQTDNQIRQNLSQDIQRINAELSITPTELAYPFGTADHVHKNVVDIASSLGFTRGYTAISKFDCASETFLIPRTCIEDEVTPRSLRLWTHGAYDVFSMIKSMIRQHVRN